MTAKLTEEVNQAIAGVVATVEILIPLSGLVDISVLAGKLAKNLAKVEGEIKSLSDRLNKPSFVEKAPEALIQKTKQALAESEKQAQILQERLKRLH